MVRSVRGMGGSGGGRGGSEAASRSGSGGKIDLPQVETAEGCLYNEAVFSSDLSHYALNCKGPGVPKVYIFQSNVSFYFFTFFLVRMTMFYNLLLLLTF